MEIPINDPATPCAGSGACAPASRAGPEGLAFAANDAGDTAGAAAERERLREQQSLIVEQQDALLRMAKELQFERDCLAEARARIAHTEKLKLVGTFVSNAVHDINNVLGAVSGAGRTLRSQLPGGPHLQVLAQTDRAVERGVKLVRQLLDFAREGGEAAESVDMRDAIVADLDLYRRLAGPGIEFIVDIEEQAWKIQASAGEVQAVLFNLIANCRDAMPTGGSVRIGLRNCLEIERPAQLRAGDYVVLDVADDGVGMPPDVLRRIGEPFFTTKAKGQGTGLGMATISDFVRDCRGMMTVESTVAAGTRVRLYFPRAPATGDLVSMPCPGPAGQAHGDARILIADTDRALREHVAVQLELLDYHVLEAENAEVARAILAREGSVDLAILGLEFGSQSGERLGQSLRQMSPALPVIFIMGAGSAKPPVNDVVFRRPISEAMLAQAILEKLGRKPRTLLSRETLLLSERVRSKIRSPEIRKVFDVWKASADRRRYVPSIDLAPELRAVTEPDCYLVKVVDRAPGAYRFVFVGSALEARLGRPLTGESVTLSAADSIVSIASAYERCAKGVAYFDYARFALEPGRVLLFERLCLPLSTSGDKVDHIFGVARFEDLAHSV